MQLRMGGLLAATRWQEGTGSPHAHQDGCKCKGACRMRPITFCASDERHDLMRASGLANSLLPSRLWKRAGEVRWGAVRLASLGLPHACCRSSRAPVCVWALGLGPPGCVTLRIPLYPIRSACRVVLSPAPCRVHARFKPGLTEHESTRLRLLLLVVCGARLGLELESCECEREARLGLGVVVVHEW
eukprot:scaffold7695_cov124-Isochrysis_galbana.AAC.5